MGTDPATNYARDWVGGAWRKLGFEYIRSPQPKGAIYLESLPVFTRGLARLPNHARLIRELRLLERRTHRSGKDTVEHPRNGHDDHANVVCGVLSLLAPPAFEQSNEIVAPIVSGGGRYFPGSSEFTGSGVPASSSAPASSYDYNSDQSWKSFVNSDGSIRSTPRSRWDV